MPSPSRPADGDEGPELVESEHPLREVAGHVLDAGQFRVPLRIVRLLPRLRPLEGDAVFDQQLTQPFPPDGDRAGGLGAQIVGELTHAPPGERPPQGFGAGVGRRDDELLVVRTELAGTATRPLRVQAGHPHLVEPMDDLPDRVLVSLHKTRDRRHGVPTG